MALREILIYPDSRLRKLAEQVEVFDQEISEFVQDMTQTMYEAPGIGLASIQVGIEKSIIVIDVSYTKDNLHVLINPQITEAKGEQVIEEGCLSFPGYFAKIKRSEWIKFSAFDVNGNHYEMEADGLFAVCVQHEIDHLNGKLFTDYLSRLKKDRVKRQFEKAARKQHRDQLVQA